MANINVNTVVHKTSNNTQRVGLRLLKANGEWIPRGSLRKRIPSALSRVRDLRKPQYGGFDVECADSFELGRKTSKKTFYYRINPNNVTKNQVSTLFGI
jgi:hypothetical protein